MHGEDIIKAKPGVVVVPFGLDWLDAENCCGTEQVGLLVHNYFELFLKTVAQEDVLDSSVCRLWG